MKRTRVNEEKSLNLNESEANKLNLENRKITLKKIKNSEDTSFNTFWMTSSFTLMMWSIAMLGFAGAY